MILPPRFRASALKSPRPSIDYSLRQSTTRPGLWGRGEALFVVRLKRHRMGKATIWRSPPSLKHALHNSPDVILDVSSSRIREKGSHGVFFFSCISRADRVSATTRPFKKPGPEQGLLWVREVPLTMANKKTWASPETFQWCALLQVCPGSSPCRGWKQRTSGCDWEVAGRKALGTFRGELLGEQGCSTYQQGFVHVSQPRIPMSLEAARFS